MPADSTPATPRPGVPFANHVGIDTRRMDAAGAESVLPHRDELLNHIGSQHAGALYTAAETASGAAMLGALGDLLSSAMPLVREASIRYTRLAKGPITASAKLAEEAGAIRERLSAAGRTDFKVHVALTDSDGLEVGNADFAWNIRQR